MKTAKARYCRPAPYGAVKMQTQRLLWIESVVDLIDFSGTCSIPSGFHIEKLPPPLGSQATLGPTGIIVGAQASAIFTASLACECRIDRIKTGCLGRRIWKYLFTKLASQGPKQFVLPPI
jgi:hypothetical protein